MARLPIIGSDSDQWGTVLNDFLRVSHREDGGLRGVCEAFNVRDFGALGDGKHDDTAAINLALSTAVNAKGFVFIPSGIYVISTGLLIQGVSLLGIAGFSLFQPTTGVDVALAIDTGDHDKFGSAHPITVQGISVVGDNTQGKIGIRLGGNKVSANIQLHQVEIYGFSGQNARGLEVVNTVGASIVNSIFAKNNVNVFVRGTTSLPTTTRFTGCQFREAWGGAGVEIEQAYLISFDNCIFEYNRQEGLRAVTRQAEQNCMRLILNKCWFEENFYGDPEKQCKYSLFADSKPKPSEIGTTVEIAIRDTHFNNQGLNSTLAISLKKVVNIVIDNTFVGNRPANILITEGSNGYILNWPQNNADFSTTVVISPDSSIYSLSWPDYEAIYPLKGSWQDWQPNVTAFANVALENTNVNTARYSKLGKTLLLDLNFTTQPTSNTAGITISLPSGVIPRDMNIYFAVPVIENETVSIGYVHTGTTDGIYLQKATGDFIANVVVGGRFTAMFEIK